MDLTHVVARLKDQCRHMKAIGGAAELDAAINSAVALPSIFVMPLDERATTAPVTGLVRQRVETVFGVIQAVANARDKGAAALASLAPVRSQVRDALVGWVPLPVNGEAVMFTGGRLLRFDGDGRLWWSDTFTVSHYFTKPRN